MKGASPMQSQIVIEASLGESIQMVAERMVDAWEAQALLSGIEGPTEVLSTFNDVPLLYCGRGPASTIVEAYWQESNRRAKVYRDSPAYAEQQRKNAEAAHRKALLLCGALAMAPDRMTLRCVAGWEQACKANTDPYGAAILAYAERWARLMEGRIAHGGTLEACASEASNIADTEGITGFMYGAAVGILAEVWVHGEALRRWHNLTTQLSDEGEQANTTGGVLNPALLRL
mgnify:CR=1 FL=1